MSVAIGLILFVIGAAGCALSGSALTMIVWRVVQAVGAFQYGFVILGSGLVGTFADATPWPMGWVIAIAGIGSLLSMRLLASSRESCSTR